MKRKVFLFSKLIIGFILAFQFSGTVAAKAATQAEDNLLGVIVMVQGDSIEVKGYCIYIKDGKEIRKVLEKDNAWGWNFHGEYIKEVKMQKVSGDASFSVFVMEGKDAASGETIFESAFTSSSKPIIYKRKK